MIDKLKAPFWFGLPVYAWVAGAVALVAGAGYFFFYARAGGTSVTPQTDSAANNTDLTPYPDPGGGSLPVPPSPVFDPNGAPIAYSGGVSYLSAQPGANPTSTLVASGTTHATSGAVAHNGKTSETGHVGKQGETHGGKTAENGPGAGRGRTTSGASGRIAGTAR